MLKGSKPPIHLCFVEMQHAHRAYFNIFGQVLYVVSMEYTTNMPSKISVSYYLIFYLFQEKNFLEISKVSSNKKMIFFCAPSTY